MIEGITRQRQTARAGQRTTKLRILRALQVTISLCLCGAVGGLVWRGLAFIQTPKPPENMMLDAFGFVLFIGSLAAILGRLSQAHRDACAASLMNLPETEATQSFALYLRPFISKGAFYDSSELSGPIGYAEYGFGQMLGNKRDLEGALVASIDLPVVCLGQPGEEIGASRIAVSEGEWQQAIVTLAEKARLILLLVSGRPGTAYEIRHVLRAQLLDKTLFICPPQNSNNSFDSRFEYAAGSDLIRDDNLDPPAWTSTGAAFYFRDGRTLGFGLGWPPGNNEGSEAWEFRMRTNVARFVDNLERSTLTHRGTAQ